MAGALGLRLEKLVRRVYRAIDRGSGFCIAARNDTVGWPITVRKNRIGHWPTNDPSLQASSRVAASRMLSVQRSGCHGLLRFARNDGLRLRIRLRGSRWGCRRLRLRDFLRHCEERSDVAVQGRSWPCSGDRGEGLIDVVGLHLRNRRDRWAAHGLLRFARNDGLGLQLRGSRCGWLRLGFGYFLRHCEERSDVAVQRGGAGVVAEAAACAMDCLLRFARNDGLGLRLRGSRCGWLRLGFGYFLRHCEERSDVAVQRGGAGVVAEAAACAMDCLLRFARNDGLGLRLRGSRCGWLRLGFGYFLRHCEERSDVAVQRGRCWRCGGDYGVRHGLPRFARNDGEGGWEAPRRW